MSHMVPSISGIYSGDDKSDSCAEKLKSFITMRNILLNINTALQMFNRCDKDS